MPWVLMVLLSMQGALAGKSTCDKFKESEDRFSGQPTLTFRAPGGWLVRSVGGKVSIEEWEVGITDPLHEPMPTGTLMKVRLADDTILELPTRDVAQPDVHAVGNSLFTSWDVAFELSSEHLAMLGSSAPQATEVRALGEVITNAHGPTMKKLGEAMACLAAKPSP